MAPYYTNARILWASSSSPTRRPETPSPHRHRYRMGTNCIENSYAVIPVLADTPQVLYTLQNASTLPSKHGPTQPHLPNTPWKAATIPQRSPGPLKGDILFVTLGLATPPLHLCPAWAFKKDPPTSRVHAAFKLWEKMFTQQLPDTCIRSFQPHVTV